MYILAERFWNILRNITQVLFSEMLFNRQTGIGGGTQLRGSETMQQALPEQLHFKAFTRLPAPDELDLITF